MHDDNKQKSYELAEELLSEQNFTAAVIAGAVAMLLAAVAYGIIVESWPFSYGFAAAGIGVSIGFFIGFLGRGISAKFAVLAAMYTIAGCILGNLFLTIMVMARATTTSPIDVLQSNPLTALAQSSVSGLSPVHTVYWFVAVVAAVFLAKRPLSREQRFAIALLQSRA